MAIIRKAQPIVAIMHAPYLSESPMNGESRLLAILPWNKQHSGIKWKEATDTLQKHGDKEYYREVAKVREECRYYRIFQYTVVQ